MKKPSLSFLSALFIAGLLVSTFALQAQIPSGFQVPASQPQLPKGNGKIFGLLIDSAGKTPVSFGTVALISKVTGKPVDGTVSDDAGKFEIAKITAGEYFLEYSFVGYKTKRSELITIAKGTEVNAGKVTMAVESKLLNEVTVVGAQDLVEEKVDRLVYNADKDIAARGGDATDILRKVPMLSVDLDGNVSLKGSQNIKVLINGKPSTISANSISSALKQIPANMIKTVEVITSPSAKYDAEGSGGIINIITKKNNLEGFSLNTDAGVGNRGAQMMLNGNYKKGKFGVSLGGFSRAMYNVVGSFSNDQTMLSKDGNVRTIQNADTKNSGLFGMYNLGFDYDIDSTQSITGNVRFGIMNMMNHQNNLLTQTYAANSTTPTLGKRDVDIKDLSNTVDASMTYTKIYKTSKELSVMGLYSLNNRTNSFITSLLDPTNNSNIGGLKNDNPSYNQESTIQLDYQTPIGKKQLIEAGGKTIYRNVNSDYQYYSLQNGSYQVDSSQPSNTLNYNQNVMAGYVSHTYTSKSKFSIKTGVRYEYTTIQAQFSKTNESLSSGIPNYGVLVPSINISKSLKGGKTLKLGYNRRIQRPGIQFLNPNMNTSNPNNITIGNPYLAPEYTDNVELGLSAQIKAVFINATLFGRITRGMITSVRDTLTRDVNGTSTQVVSTTYKNIGQEDAYGINVFSNVTIASKLQLGFGTTIYHTYLTNNSSSLSATNSGFVVQGMMFSNYTIKNGWGMQAFGGMRGNQIQLQGYQGGFAFYSLGVKKDFKNKRGSFGIAAENFFNHPFKVNSEVNSSTIAQKSTNAMYNAGIRVNVTYRIGKMTFDTMGKKKKSVKNDDVKGVEDNNSQQGGGQRPQQ